MKNLLRVVAAALFVSATAASARACPECESPYKPGTYTGEARRVGNGVAYSWVTLDKSGKPAAIGITITETALEGLPETGTGGMPFVEYALALPKQAGKTVFDHAVLNWNPKGHIPEGIYTVPHFDIHFYTIKPAERMKITAKGADLARCRKHPPAGMIPAGYIYAPGGEEPEMGAHWVDPTSPEFQGQPFTKTFLYGSYNGRMTFLEPMLTLDYLRTQPAVSEKIKLPARYATDAYFPTHYSIRHDAVRKEYAISLDAMAWRTAAVSPKRAAATAAARKATKTAASK